MKWIHWMPTCRYVFLAEVWGGGGSIVMFETVTCKHMSEKKCKCLLC